MNLSLRQGLLRELRAVAVDGFEIRSNADGTFTFEGYASVTGHPYTVHDMLGSFTETVERGAFSKTLKTNPDVQFLINHAGMALARTQSGTMRLAEDDHGLHVAAQLDPRMSVAADLRVAIERGDMDQMSFGFRVPKGGDTWTEDWTQRSIHEVALDRGDVSVVNQGANPATVAAVRSFTEHVGAEPAALAAAIASVESGTAGADDFALLSSTAERLSALVPAAEPEPVDLTPNQEALEALWAKRLPA